MPVYEYQCRSCGRRFEALRRMSERTQAPRCPKCGAEETELAFSAPAFLGGSSGGSSGSCGTSTWTGGG
ncbi:MAG: zinc ribbon domain-containing protein [Gemmatimonadetes bacterium]|nr:zinc ribbon domain-containing protein [Gemmatimonadota bacterium]